MGHDSATWGDPPLQARRSAWIETFRSRSRCDLRSHWQRIGAAHGARFVEEPWGQEHRPDWAARGLLIWPRGRQWLRLEQELLWPAGWSSSERSCVRLCLSWWAEAARLWVDGLLVHEGDLFDTACRWTLPPRFQAGDVLKIQLELCSPLHDDGALISSCLDLEPNQAGQDPDGILLPEALQLHLETGGELPADWQALNPCADAARDAVAAHLASAPRLRGGVHWFGHAHLDLAWLWPVADTWQAAERTFRSALELMNRWPELHFAHSTPALYAWIERHRPDLFEAIRGASKAGRWEPINGPWVETDCVLVSTASLWQQFALGQAYSRRVFPEWRHHLAWLPDSFGFAAGLPAVAQQTGVHWFCTHKLAWNATNPFPHRLFRWRSRGGSELLSLMLPPIGRRGDPLDMLQEQRQWQASTGVDEALWIPGVGDHGGGPTEEMLEQMQLWDGAPTAVPRHHGSLRAFLEQLEPLGDQLPVWRDELYLELHRGCATSRPDQKRHNRSLERLLREADTLATLLAMKRDGCSGSDWRPLLFQQFHDILPGTSIPEVFEQAEPIWRQARRTARQQRDCAVQTLLGQGPATQRTSTQGRSQWFWMGCQPLARWSPVLRLPVGHWRVEGEALAQQGSVSGGVWVQLPEQRGISSVALHRDHAALATPLQPRNPVSLMRAASGVWTMGNSLVSLDCSEAGVLQLRDAAGADQLSGPLQIARYADRGEFWDAWDIAADYRAHPLEVRSLGEVQVLEAGPLVGHLALRFQVGLSTLRLDLRLRADCPWLELIAAVDWRQCHELLRIELPLATPAVRVAADTSGGVLERPARAVTPGEQARWEVAAISWVASQAVAPGGGVAVLLDGPQGVSGTTDQLGVSLLRGPTWPDPSADRGLQRSRLAFMPFAHTWARAAVPQAAIAFREPGWHGPVAWADQASSPRLDRWLPPLPAELNPVALVPSDAGPLLRLLNPGASRCRWTPGGSWRVGRESADGDSVELAPGELAELHLAQSS